MDVFSFRDKVVEDYGQFSRSFTQIKAPDLRDFVDGRYGDEEYWPSPLIRGWLLSIHHNMKSAPWRS
jgi:hypothetical protein